MATAEQYAEWIVNNKDKKGTPEFNKVAEAYRLTKSNQETAPQEAPGQIARQPGGVLNPVQPDDQKSYSDILGTQALTGEDRMTPEMEQLQEIGAAPELNEMSVPAFKTSLGLLATGKTEELKSILSKQLPGVSFTEDSKGNTIVNLPSGQYALNTPGLSGQDIIRGLFDAAAFTPAGGAKTIKGAALGSMLTESGIEGIEASLGGEFSGTDVIAAGGIGGTAKGLEKGIGAVYRGAKGRVTDDIVDAGKDAGIPVMTSDVVPPKTFAGKIAQQTGEKIPFAGTGGLRETQQVAREQAVNEFSERYGEFSYKAIVDSLKSQKSRVKNAAGRVFEATGRKLDDLGEIPVTGTRTAIKNASQELNKSGVIRSSQAMDDLQTLINSIDEAPQTFSTLKENRTAFREIIKGADKAERTQLTSRAKTLLENVERAMKKDMDKFAKTNLSHGEFSKWQKANKVYAEEATKLTKSRLKNVLDKGDITPENVQTLLFSQKPSEVRSLYQSLTPDGRANARSAIISKVVTNLNKRASGISPNSFASELNKFGLQTNQFFKGEEKKALSGLLKVLNATRRAQDAAVTTPTGQAVLGGGTGYALFADPTTTIAAGTTLGATARLYESPIVRNALLRLDSVPAGSTQFEKALAEVFQAVTATGQALREGTQDN